MYVPLNIFHYFKNKELGEIYVSVAIKAFALSMISIFIPVYLYQLGFSFATIIAFFGVVSLTSVIFSIPVSKLASKKGFKHTILYSVPFLIVAYILLYTIEQFGWWVYLPAILIGVSKSLFWTSYHVDFAFFSNKRKRGSQIGNAKIFISLFSVLGPIIGGITLAFFGFKLLFLVVSGILFFSTVPLFMSKDIHDPIDFSVKEVFKNRKWKDFLGFFGNGVESRMGITLWPLFAFIFILGSSYIDLGSLTSVGLLFSLIFIFFIGKFSNIKRKSVLKFAAITNLFIWTMRFFIKTIPQLFVVDSIYGANRSMIGISFDAISYDKAKKGDIVKAIAFRQISLNLGGAVSMFVLALLIDPLSKIFIGGGIGSLLLLLF